MYTNQGASFLNGRVRVLTGDITRQETDAIVNAANSTLLGGAGVDGAIHRRGGARILEECRELRRTTLPDGLQTGECVITSAGLLPCRYVIHTVGPIYGRHAGREPDLLAKCYGESLELASSHNLSSVSFPAISTGAYGYPKTAASKVSSIAVARFLSENATISEVRLIFFADDDTQLFLENQSFENLESKGESENG